MVRGVDSISVTQTRRRAGQRLVNFAKQSRHKVWSYTHISQLAARALYEKNGFPGGGLWHQLTGVGAEDNT